MYSFLAIDKDWFIFGKLFENCYLNLKQTFMKKITLLFLFLSTISFSQVKVFKPAVVYKSFTGVYDSEGLVDSKGHFELELTQVKSKISGIANYQSYDGWSTGDVDVSGYVKKGIAYITLYHYRRGLIANGSFKLNSRGVDLVFIRSDKKGDEDFPQILYTFKR